MYDDNFYAKLQKEEEAQQAMMDHEGEKIKEHLQSVRESREPNWHKNNRVRSALTTKVY
jgi:hypothetical protein